MRTPTVVLAAALVVGATTGCAATDEPGMPQAVVANQDDVLAELRAAPGVVEATISVDDDAASLLTVELDPVVTPDQLAVIGDRLEEYESRADDVGQSTDHTELRLDASTYSYFAGLSGAALDAQLRFWHDLVSAGAEHVVITDDAAVVVASDVLPTTPPAGNTQAGPRFVLIDLPEVPSESHLSTTLANLAAVHDPGAPGGQWRFADLAPNTVGIFSAPAMPDQEQLASAMEAGALFDGVDGIASIEVSQAADEGAPLVVSIASFDEAMDGIPAAQATREFTRTESHDQVLALIEMLERRAVPSYEISMLSSPLLDGGNFALRVRVEGCTFTGDARWPELSQRLGKHWLDHLSLQRYPAGDKHEQCRVDVPSVVD